MLGVITERVLEQEIYIGGAYEHSDILAVLNVFVFLALST